MNQLQATTAQPATAAGAWHPVCALDDIWPNMGVCALIEGQQIAIFRLKDGELYALDNHDPHSEANVLSRGLIGDLGGEPVVASPIYKHHYQLRTGLCVEDANICLNVYPVEVRDGKVWVQR